MIFLSRIIISVTLLSVLPCSDFLFAGGNTESDALYEEIHTLTDRDIYISGEDILIQSFIYDALTGKASDISSVLYFELLGKENETILQARLNIENGNAHGRIALPLDIPSGYYKLRTYTRLIREAGPAGYSHKQILIINPFEENSGFHRIEKTKRIDLPEFFPEGGFLVAGESNLLVVKFPSASPEQQSIYLFRDSLLIDSCTISHGLASFRFEAMGEGEYLSLSKSVDERWPLATFYHDGIRIELKEAKKDSWALNFRNSFGNILESLKMQLVKGGIVISEKPLVLARQKDIIINRSNLVKGIYCVRILDTKGEVLAQRQLAHYPQSKNKPAIKTDRSSYAPREKITLNIKNTPGASFNSVNIRVVSNPLLFDHFSQDPDMISAGKAFQDEYFMNLMLVTDHAKATVKNHKNNKAVIPDYRGSVVGGTAYEKTTGNPLRDEELWITTTGKHQNPVPVLTDQEGRFYTLMNNRGMKDIVVRPFDTTMEVEIQLDEDFSSEYLPFHDNQWEIPKSRLEEINQAVINMQLKGLFPFSGNDSLQPPESRRFYGKPGAIVKIDKYIKLPVMEEIIREIVPYVYFRKKQGNYSLYIADEDTKQIFENEPLRLLDGVPVSNTNLIMKLNPQELEFIEVVYKRFFYCGEIYDGIIHFVSREGKFSLPEPGENVFRQVREFPGIAEEFHAPDYSRAEWKNNPRPDFRNTLYWNPSVNIEAGEKKEIVFYAGDNTGTFSIILEGISTQGESIRLSKEIIVE